jgi:histidinol dehydrogenase
MSELALRIVVGVEEARRSVLRRDPLGDPELPEAVQAAILETFGSLLTAAQVVARIIEDVRREGDAAVKHYSQRFDGSADRPMEVTTAEIDAAFDAVPRELIEAVEFMADRVRTFHAHQLEHMPRSFTEHGLGMIVRPIQRAGIYMTGNVAVLPSSR